METREWVLIDNYTARLYIIEFEKRFLKIGVQRMINFYARLNLNIRDEKRFEVLSLL